MDSRIQVELAKFFTGAAKTGNLVGVRSLASGPGLR